MAISSASAFLLSFFFVFIFHTSNAARLHISRALVPEAPLILEYHGGPLLAGKGSLPIYLIWYGNFNAQQKSVITDFLASFSPSKKHPTLPSVAAWWSHTAKYKDSTGKSVYQSVEVKKQITDLYSMGKHLNRNDTQELVLRAVFGGTFPLDTKALYLVLTSSDVTEHGFCFQNCGYHRHTNETDEPPKDPSMAFGWVGNPETQCPGKCAWPFAHPGQFFGPDKEPLLPPNKDVGLDGMIINLASIIAGAATNPYASGYYQGHKHMHLGAVTACSGIYGKGAFPGHPGELLLDKTSGASFNAYGINGREYLLPAIWDPATSKCAFP